MSNTKTALTKDDLNKALDNINMWINNCDTKTAIALGFYATVIAVFLATDFMDTQVSVFSYVLNNINFFSIVYAVIHCSAIIVFVIGIFELFRSVIPKQTLEINKGHAFNSVLFFGSIAKNLAKYEDFHEEIEKVTNESIIEDLLFQVHSAALICNNKFRYQKVGLWFTLVSGIVFLITTVIGVVII